VAFQPLDIDRVAHGVATLSLRPHLVYVPSADSTNRVARDLPEGAWHHGTSILTDFQEAGRGRQGRGWVSPPGTSLLLSIVLVPPPHVSPPDIVMAAALAVADTVASVTGLPAALKWPNDVLVGGKKVCGILAEYADEGSRRRAILGIGLNVNFDPATEGIADATGLSAELGAPLDRESCAISLFRALDMWYGALTEDSDSVFAAWEARLETVGRQVVVIESKVTWQGIAIGVARNGGLRVEDGDGNTRVVYAGDVSVRTP
jgi:BirA family biotin operon repressor/biotin-[acetyl-CoA-carboxylase] ligase